MGRTRRGSGYGLYSSEAERQTYNLEVSVDPTDGELDIGDNRKAFDIQIHQE